MAAKDPPMTNERDHIASLREDNATLRNRVTDLTRERDEYKIWWTRDSKSLGTALNDLSMERSCKQDLQAQVSQLRGNLSLAEEGLAAAVEEIQGLRQFKDWAEPQIVTHGQNAVEIERLHAALEEARGCHDQPCSCGACFAISNALNRPSHEPEKSP
jgi:hypothetical protein